LFGFEIMRFNFIIKTLKFFGGFKFYFFERSFGKDIEIIGFIAKFFQEIINYIFGEISFKDLTHEYIILTFY